MKLCPSLTIKNYYKFQVQYSYGVGYRDSISSESVENCPKVLIFEIETTSGIHRRFKGLNFRDTLCEALVFNEWLTTADGKNAVEIYNNY
jgi:hypothetical protein